MMHTTSALTVRYRLTHLHHRAVCWRIDNDLGQPHDILLPNTYYSPHGKHRLLCPQHWAQTAKDNHPHPNGTWCATYADYVVLHWGQQRHRRTGKLLPHTNVGIIRTTPRIQQYAHTCTLLEWRWGTLAMPATIKLGLKNSTEKETVTNPVVITDSEEEPSKGERIPETSLETHEATQQESPPDNQPFTFGVENILGSGESLPEDIHQDFSLAQQELLHWHYRLNHLSFTRIQEMAKQRLLLTRLAKCTAPLCSGCTYGKMTRCPWRTKAPYSAVPKIATAPGQCVAVDQLDATVPGLTAQLKGIPATKRYNYTTIFIDHYSELTYIHLKQTLTSKDTVNAKKATLSCRQRTFCQQCLLRASERK